MIPVDVTLGLPPEVLRGIKAGRLYRDGGIIRDGSSGRIVTLLKDSDLQGSPLESVLTCSVVPLAMSAAAFAALERRLAQVQASLVALGVRLSAALRLANVQLEGMLIGSLLGNIQACQLDLASERMERLPSYRQALLVDYNRLRVAVTAAAAHLTDVVRYHSEELRELARAALIAGVAARDLAARMGEGGTATEMARNMEADWTWVHESMKRHLDHPRALFWARPVHWQIHLELVESSRRLAAHNEVGRLRFVAWPGSQWARTGRSALITNWPPWPTYPCCLQTTLGTWSEQWDGTP